MTDQDGNIYKTIVIGNQIWMAENLKTSHYRNGDLISNVTDNTQWSGLTAGAWAFSNNNSQFDCPYGKLYNWYAVSDPRNLCPTGWHVPTEAEWITLTDYLGGEAVAGGKMTTTGTQYWPNTQDPTNESGFSGLPGGFRLFNGIFFQVGVETGQWWSSSVDVDNYPRYRYLQYGYGNAIFTGSNVKPIGMSVRCLSDSSKQQDPTTQTQFPVGSVFCASGATAIVNVTNPKTGKIWMDRNLGASQAATSITDANAYGDLYQWGRRSDGHQCRSSLITNTTSSIDQPANGNFIAGGGIFNWRVPQNNNLWQGISGINNPCPSSYRLPTAAELNEERASWSSQNSAGAFASPLKFTLAGLRGDTSSSSLFVVGEAGQYWTSVFNNGDPSSLGIGSGVVVGGNYPMRGLSVRCIKEYLVGTLTSLSCSTATNTGTITKDFAAVGVNSIISYTGGNGGTYASQNIASTGVTGLTASIPSGTLQSGTGILTYTITGTPTSSGTASFALSIGGQTCILTRTVTFLVGSISELGCSTSVNTGILTQGIAAASISSSVPYTGGNGGTIPSQTITSTGVTGLTATLTSGTLLNGAGVLTYTITGTPATIGTASFALNVGGQTCSLTREIGQTGINAHTCGANNVHNSAKTYGSMTDQEGNVYKTIVIGNQEWMAENLKTSIYRNGNSIGNITDNSQWSSLTTGAWCNLNNNNSLECPYGKLYNWYAVADSRNVCPIGWHVPTDFELRTLYSSLGGESVAGSKMRSTGTSYWPIENGFTNESGFSGLPGSVRNTNGQFTPGNNVGGWWSSSEVSTAAWILYLTYSYSPAARVNYDKHYGYSVRCLRD
jgi:uncharacterized protein (TIGR02145 family)